jgi:hypothetical protein
MTTYHQTIVSDQVFGKRFSELTCEERAQVNIFIEKFTAYAVQKHQNLIRCNFKRVLAEAKKSKEEFNEFCIEV